MGCLAWLGTALEVVGVLIALTGVAQLHKDLTGMTLQAGLASTLKRWWDRVRRRPQVWEGNAASVGLVAARSELTADAWKNPPDDPEEQLGYLLERVAVLRDMVIKERSRRRDADRRLEDEARARERTLRGEIQAVGRNVSGLRSAMSGGSDGRGLQLAAVGLGCTALGLVLSSIA